MEWYFYPLSYLIKTVFTSRILTSHETLCKAHTLWYGRIQCRGRNVSFLIIY